MRLIKPDRDEWHVLDFVSEFQSDSMLRVVLPNICSCLRLLLVQASTTCTAEHAFSVMRRLRTYLRSTCGQARFNHGAICHVHADRLDKVDIQDVVDEWRDSKGIAVRQNQVASRVEWNNKLYCEIQMTHIFILFRYLLVQFELISKVGRGSYSHSTGSF